MTGHGFGSSLPVPLFFVDIPLARKAVSVGVVQRGWAPRRFHLQLQRGCLRGCSSLVRHVQLGFSWNLDCTSTVCLVLTTFVQFWLCVQVAVLCGAFVAHGRMLPCWQGAVRIVVLLYCGFAVLLFRGFCFRVCLVITCGQSQLFLQPVFFCVRLCLQCTTMVVIAAMLWFPVWCAFAHPFCALLLLCCVCLHSYAPEPPCVGHCCRGGFVLIESC